MNDTYFGQLLISMPNLKDPFFQKTVILICEFSKQAIMGLIINKPIDNIKIVDILKNIQLNVNHEFVNRDVFLGGPVHTGQGFIIHSSECDYEGSQIINKNLKLTTSLKILKDISNNKPPKFYKVILGCSVWGYKQFNNEMLENSWHLMNAANEIIFQYDNLDKLWETCIEESGIIKERLNPYHGNA
tara:strand:- start:961 stop:1521 length:561 start_codon:yes stop_codon:yes gene_type:complete